MSVRGFGRLRHTARQLKNRLTPTALILLYHRVAESPSDPQLLCVTPQHFAQHLEVLRRRCRPMGLQELTLALRDGTLRRRAVAVTFDDGYSDNLHNAKPLLERHDMPATVFVVSGYAGQGREFWWDELDGLLLQPGRLPETLRLRLDGRTYQWELGNAAHYAGDAYRSHRRWNVLEVNDPGPRQHLYRSLCRLLRPLPGEERRGILDELTAWAGRRSAGRKTHRVLSVDEVSRLAEGGLIEIGAHTVSHPVLAALPAGEQRGEILGSKAHLEEVLGRAVIAFSYPYGARSDYTTETVAIVQEAGFACACSNVADVVCRASDRFQLPRVLVRDWDGDEFARRLKGWFRG